MPSRYRAFLSYSHADSAFAERFHRDIESWRADRGLLGRDTPRGPVPRTLRPVFRDRDDFAGGRTLSQATAEALEASDFMIVLCSPQAARSQYVNEEIRLFKAMGGADRIIPVIIAGEPGDPVANCFPQALLRHVDAQGRITDTPEEPLAADAREQGDGPRRALAKVIAGLLGVPFDEIVRRAERAQRQRHRIIAGTALAMCVLALLAGGFGWLAEQRRVVAERNYQAALDAADNLMGNVVTSVASIEGVRLETTRSLIEQAESVYDQLIASVPGSPELRLRKAQALIQFAGAYTAKGDQRGAAASYDEAEALLLGLLEDAPEALDRRSALAFVRIGRAGIGTEVATPQAQYELLREPVTWFMRAPPGTIAAVATAMVVATAASVVAVGLEDAGEAATADEALAFLDALIGAWGMHDGRPRDAQWQKLTLTRPMVEVLRRSRAGDIDGALARFAAVQATLSGMADERGERGRSERKMLAEFVLGVALILHEAGETDRARHERDRALNMLTDLASADREDTDAIAQAAAARIDAALVRLDDPARAAAIGELHAAVLSLDAAAAAAGPLSAEAARLDDGLGRAVDALNHARLHAEALDVGTRLLAQRERVAALRPDDTGVRRDIVGVVGAMAHALEELGRRDEAQALRERQLEVDSLIASHDPDHRARLATSHWNVGLNLWSLSRRAEALVHIARAVALQEAALAAAPDSMDLADTLGTMSINLGELHALASDAEAARAAFERAHLLRTRVLAARPEDPFTIGSMAWAEFRLALLGDTAAERWARMEALLGRADAITPLADWEDELLVITRLRRAVAAAP